MQHTCHHSFCHFIYFCFLVQISINRSHMVLGPRYQKAKVLHFCTGFDYHAENSVTRRVLLNRFNLFKTLAITIFTRCACCKNCNM